MSERTNAEAVAKTSGTDCTREQTRLGFLSLDVLSVVEVVIVAVVVRVSGIDRARMLGLSPQS